MKKFVATRLAPQDLQNAVIVVLHGVDEKLPNLKVMGWTEDGPHDDSDEAVKLFEPIYFFDDPPSTKGAPVEFTIVAPHLGIANSTEFFNYNKVDCYEGVSEFGSFYIEAVLWARDYKLSKEKKLMFLRTKPTPSQPQAQQQQLPLQNQQRVM